METKKLYVLDVCMICRGKCSFRSCHYCSNGQTYVETSDKTLKKWFESLEDDRKKEILLLFGIIDE